MKAIFSLRLSVVIPVFNRQSDLDRALKSLEAETDLVHEIIVVDDASRPPITINAAPCHAHKIRMISLPNNLGSSGARQAGINETTGELVAFLDSDDLWLPGKLRSQLKHFSTTDDLLAVGVGWQVDDETNGKSWFCVPLASSEKTDFSAGCWFCPGSTVVISKKALSLVGPLDPDLRRLEDLDWYLRFALAGGRLEIAEGIGVVIKKLRHQRRSDILEAIKIISAKPYCDQLDPLKPIIMQNLSAWLDVERAAMEWYSGSRLVTFFFVIRSVLKKPRLTLHLRKWWQILPAKSSRYYHDGHRIKRLK